MVPKHISDTTFPICHQILEKGLLKKEENPLLENLRFPDELFRVIAFFVQKLLSLVAEKFEGFIQYDINCPNKTNKKTF